MYLNQREDLFTFKDQKLSEKVKDNSFFYILNWIVTQKSQNKTTFLCYQFAARLSSTGNSYADYVISKKYPLPWKPSGDHHRQSQLSYNTTSSAYPPNIVPGAGNWLIWTWTLISEPLTGVHWPP